MNLPSDTSWRDLPAWVVENHPDVEAFIADDGYVASLRRSVEASGQRRSVLRFRLGDLLAYAGDHHGEVDVGAPVGKEFW